MLLNTPGTKRHWLHQLRKQVMNNVCSRMIRVNDHEEALNERNKQLDEECEDKNIDVLKSPSSPECKAV